MAKISIIIPTLNEEKLLERTLSQFSAEIKSKFQLEIIVSDGGSTDNTISIAKKYSAIIIQKENNAKENIAMGRNRGAKVANNGTLVFLNADTQIKNVESFFLKIASSLNRQNVAGVTCSVYIFPEEELLGERVIHWCINHWFWFLNVIGIGMGRGECNVVKNHLFKELGGYNETMSAGEDFDLFTRLRRKGEIKFLRNVIVYESPRRYRKYGYGRILMQWFFNAMSVLLFKKSYSEEWEQIR